MSGTVAICGVGNLGRRYLEGVLQSGSVDVVHVYDTSQDSLHACQEVIRRFCGGRINEATVEVRVHDAINSLPTNLDLAIVATTADVRPQLVTDLSSHTRVGHYVLEKVLAQEESGLDQLLDVTVNSHSWVNLPRRMMDWHYNLFELVRGNGPISMEVSGGAWGLACNAVHYMDLLMWWSGQVPRTVDTASLDPTWTPSKRKGFWEVYGSMSVTYSDGSHLVVRSDHNTRPVTIEASVGGMVWVICESDGVARRSDGFSQPCVCELQSAMTPRLVDSILTSEICALPTLEDSVGIHRVLLQGLLEHWLLSGGQQNGVPIT